ASRVPADILPLVNRPDADKAGSHRAAAGCAVCVWGKPGVSRRIYVGADAFVRPGGAALRTWRRPLVCPGPERSRRNASGPAWFSCAPNPCCLLLHLCSMSLENFLIDPVSSHQP